MRYELALIRSVPKEKPTDPTHPRLLPQAPTRRALREITDSVIDDALMQDDLPALVSTLSATMLLVANAIDELDIEPGVPDFMLATRTLISASRDVMDRGLLITDWDRTRQGAVMLELTVRGVCAALSVPYDDVLREVHRALMAGEQADVRPILVAAGLLTKENDDGHAGDSDGAGRGAGEADDYARLPPGGRAG